MQYSIEPRDRRYVKGYGFLSFDKTLVNTQLKLLKILAKVISIVKNLLILLCSLGQLKLQQMQ